MFIFIFARFVVPLTVDGINVAYFSDDEPLKVFVDFDSCLDLAPPFPPISMLDVIALVWLETRGAWGPQGS